MPTEIAPEYIAARRVLLDCLELFEPQLDALVLVGAHAIYLQTPEFDPGPPALTTDGDLAINPELLMESPDLGAILETSNFRRHSSPGTWISPDGVHIDLMVPDRVLPLPSRRTAVLPGQSLPTARRTLGLELCLSDNTNFNLTALEEGDARTFRLRVASPSALLVAKLIKVEERLNATNPDRVLAKDASDVLRLLRHSDTTVMGLNLARAQADGLDAGTVALALHFLSAQVIARDSALVNLSSAYHQPLEAFAQIDIAYRTLGQRLVDEFARASAKFK